MWTLSVDFLHFLQNLLHNLYQNWCHFLPSWKWLKACFKAIENIDSMKCSKVSSCYTNSLMCLSGPLLWPLATPAFYNTRIIVTFTRNYLKERHVVGLSSTFKYIWKSRKLNRAATLWLPHLYTTGGVAPSTYSSIGIAVRLHGSFWLQHTILSLSCKHATCSLYNTLQQSIWPQAIYWLTQF